MNVTWLKSGPNNEAWYPFRTVDLSHDHFNNLVGVYIIWQGGAKVVRVGQGKIRERLTDHRNSQQISKLDTGNLCVTWASVGAANLDGVERFLGDTLKPVIAERFPDVAPIPVNLPW